MKLFQVFLALLLAGTVLFAACTQTAPPTAPPVTTESLPTPSPAVTVSPPAPATTGPGAASPTPNVTQPPRNPDPAFVVDIYKPEKAWPGTTLLPDSHDLSRPRIVEVNMWGEVTWEYVLPADLKGFINPGEDVELLPNGNILVLFPRKGVYEITRGKEIAWKYLDPKVSHDADRLPDGNTLIAFGAYDTLADMQVKEVNPRGEIVWSWHARDSFNRAPYLGVSDEGWTHTNAVSRLSNGNTLVSPRNFNLMAEVDPSGKLVRTYGEGLAAGQHDPEVQPDGNILFANHARPQMAIEMAPNGTILWQFGIPDTNAWPLRDADRLPNGNTLITCADRIIEVTPEKEVVWRLSFANLVFANLQEHASRGFYKAERV
ncbi:MAG: aryl-sulfate sulfotransferase [Methanomicrobiales archaeon]|nr:aryl-sulfate sulfotransferase [Methanomicrobiales archaeon]MDD1669054.1 aryl-sulfate sulfotransferase [Methanomicrobiales archaeon]